MSEKEEGEEFFFPFLLSPVRLSPTPWVALSYSSQAFSVPQSKMAAGSQRVLTNTPALQTNSWFRPGSRLTAVFTFLAPRGSSSQFVEWMGGSMSE